MSLTRRSFVKTAGVGGLGALTLPLIAARGSEALRDGIFEEYAPESLALSAADERIAYRTAFKTGIRLDSNENPNGPGQVAFDGIRSMFVEANRYPDAPGADLQASIAKHRKVAAEN